MDQMELYNIAELNMELINPFSSDKIITIGKFLNLKKDDRVIEFGSGFAEILVLWAESFSTKGIGIDIREHACERAQKRLKRKLPKEISMIELELSVSTARNSNMKRDPLMLQLA
jgi:cyclopropane fatty-acyl-phospholipid synthase-like methyltransferase